MSTKSTLPGKAPYDGPKTFWAILKQIHKDSRKEMSLNYINSIVRAFLLFPGIGRYMKEGIDFRVRGFGTFKITQQEVRRREKRKLDQKERAKIAVRPYQRKYRFEERARKSLVKLNKRRAESGMKPMSLKDFLLIRKQKQRRAKRRSKNKL
jgi:hypothetical protein